MRPLGIQVKTVQSVAKLPDSGKTEKPDSVSLVKLTVSVLTWSVSVAVKTNKLWYEFKEYFL